MFSAQAGNWPDLRSAGSDRFMLAWCHGAPGIGLGRVASLRTLNDTALLADIEAAVAATLGAPRAGSHAVCHGELGNLDLLVTAARRFERPAQREMALVRAHAVLEAEDWRDAVWRADARSDDGAGRDWLWAAARGGAGAGAVGAEPGTA